MLLPSPPREHGVPIFPGAVKTARQRADFVLFGSVNLWDWTGGSSEEPERSFRKAAIFTSRAPAVLRDSTGSSLHYSNSGRAAYVAGVPIGGGS